MKYQERARKTDAHRDWAQNTQCAYACVATFLTSCLKISGFRWKQKMRLRTFDDSGNIAKSGAECLTPHASFKRLAADIKDQHPGVLTPEQWKLYHKTTTSARGGVWTNVRNAPRQIGRLT